MTYSDKIYGEATIEQPLDEIIRTGTFKRLKNIHQGGAFFIADPKVNHTRYEHSIGVMILIKRLGGNAASQMAGLLHDISHTAFSHLIDYVLEYEGEDYHEERFEKVLGEPDIKDILDSHGYLIEHFMDLEKFPVLEYPLPSLSADRIDYTLRDLYQIGAVKKEEIDWFLDGLVLQQERIFVKEKVYALWFRDKYDFLVNDYFNAPVNQSVTRFMTSLVQKYYQRGDILISDFHGDDSGFLSKLESLTNQNLQTLFNEWKSSETGTESVKIKSRKVDPEIFSGGQIIKLSQIES